MDCMVGLRLNLLSIYQKWPLVETIGIVSSAQAKYKKLDIVNTVVNIRII